MNTRAHAAAWLGATALVFVTSAAIATETPQPVSKPAAAGTGSHPSANHAAGTKFTVSHAKSSVAASQPGGQPAVTQHSAHATISTESGTPVATTQEQHLPAAASKPAAATKVVAVAKTPTVARTVSTAKAPVVARAATVPLPNAAATPSQGPVATKPSKVSAQAASMTPSITPVQPARPAPGPSAAKAVPGPDAAPVEERVTYQYNALGRRDPFAPLVGGVFVGAEEQQAPPDVGGLRVVGIVWGAEDKFALVEDPRGNSRVLRTGDKVMNGVVDGLRRDAVIVKLTTEGGTELVQIPLTRKGDDSNANR